MRGKHFWANRPCASCRFLVHDKKNMVKGWKTISIGTFCRGVGVRMVRNIINFPCSSPLWWLIRVSSSSWLQFFENVWELQYTSQKILFFHVHFTSMAFLWHDDCGMIVWTMRGILRPVMKKRRPRFYLVDPKKSSVPSSRALLNLIQMSLFGFFKINLIILHCRFRTRHWTKSTNCSWWIFSEENITAYLLTYWRHSFFKGGGKLIKNLWGVENEK